VSIGGRPDNGAGASVGSSLAAARKLQLTPRQAGEK
jgi:hypothetical protein